MSKSVEYKQGSLDALVQVIIDRLDKFEAKLEKTMSNSVSRDEFNKFKEELQPIIDSVINQKIIKKSDKERINFIMMHGGKIISALAFIASMSVGGLIYESKIAVKHAREAPAANERVVNQNAG